MVRPLLQPDDHLLTVKEAARKLGVSVRTVERIRSFGQLEVVRIGRRVLYSPRSITRYIESRVDNPVRLRRVV